MIGQYTKLNVTIFVGALLIATTSVHARTQRAFPPSPRWPPSFMAPLVLVVGRDCWGPTYYTRVQPASCLEVAACATASRPTAAPWPSLCRQGPPARPNGRRRRREPAAASWQRPDDCRLSRILTEARTTGRMGGWQSLISSWRLRC
jgi:hypothetical protein